MPPRLFVDSFGGGWLTELELKGIVLLGLTWGTIQTGAVGELDSAENPLLRPVSLKANLMPN